MNIQRLTRKELRQMLHIASAWSFEDEGEDLWDMDDEPYIKYRDDWIKDYKQALYDRMLEYTKEE